VRHSGRLVALAAVALALASCSGKDSSSPHTDRTPLVSPSTSAPSSPKPSPDPPPPMHACYRMAYDAALAPTNEHRPVPCAGPHSAVTFFIGHFDPGLAVDGPQVHRIESTVCPRRFATFVGGTPEDRRLSLLRPVWFAPSIEQAALGSHWFQCAVIALSDDQHLARLTHHVDGALERPEDRDHYALCGTAEPGTTGFTQRMCAFPHSWTALRTVPFAPGTYPGEDKVRAAGQTPCQDAGREAANDPLNYRWSYQWPTLKQWQAGQTWGVCWAPS
jgi:hypothetical protein